LTQGDAVEDFAVSSILFAPYRLIGNRLVKLLPFFESLKGNLIRSNLKISLPIYAAYMLFFSAAAFVAVFVVTAIPGFILGISIMPLLALALAFGVLAGASTFTTLYVYPSIVSDSRSRHLDEELPYLAIHMAVLSQAGMPPERILRSVSMIGSKKLQSVAAEEARNMVRDVNLLGLDVVSSMARSASRSPSRKFAELLKGLVSVTESGGDMTRYFLSAAKGYMDQVRISAKQLSEALGNIAELYVAMMVVFPLMIVIMLAVMGVLGGTLAGVSIIMVMYLVAYVAVPVMATIVLVFLDGLMPPR
jgi:flagellar protein FlaJ